MTSSFRLAAALFALIFLLGGASTWAQTYASKAVAADEQAMAAEKRPDFSSPVMEDRSISVAGLPEKLIWYTSRPGIFGSRRARQGGTYRGYIVEFPDTFRTVGPNSNHGYRPLFTTSPGLVEINAETKQWMPAMATHWAFGAEREDRLFQAQREGPLDRRQAGHLGRLHLHARVHAQPPHPGSLVQ